MTLDASQHSRARPIPLKVYRSRERLTVAAPMAGLEPEDYDGPVNLDS
jgi:hypothetical protein